jgi:pimeloyl-ACP methyl ester carboxylesterase
VSLAAALAALAATAASSQFVARPCADAALAKIARCGTVSVPENRDRAGGRSIALNVVVLPATGPAPHLPPLFDIDGGPGLPATKNVGFYAIDGAAYRLRRDIVLVDQRGTGGSNPLHCPELSAPATAYEPMFDPALVERCATRLRKNSDLLRYGTAEAVADLDAVRAALGYERIDLSGLSYGTTVALNYMAAYPQRVRTAVLMGVNPSDARPPRLHAPAAERALTLLFGQCRRDRGCARLGDPDANLARAREALARIKGAPSDAVFMEKLRAMMYAPAGARRVPFVVARAAAGDLAPFFAATKPQPSPNADGMFMSVICSESMKMMDVTAARRVAARTRFGDYRLRRQLAACARWPARPTVLQRAPATPSQAAVLLVSGELDPVTPPALADGVARRFANIRHVVIPGSGHIFDGMSGIDTCLDPLIVRFLDSGDLRDFDSACVAAMRPPPFVTASRPQ